MFRGWLTPVLLKYVLVFDKLKRKFYAFSTRPLDAGGPPACSRSHRPVPHVYVLPTVADHGRVVGACPPRIARSGAANAVINCVQVIEFVSGGENPLWLTLKKSHKLT